MASKEKRELHSIVKELIRKHPQELGEGKLALRFSEPRDAWKLLFIYPKMIVLQFGMVACSKGAPGLVKVFALLLSAVLALAFFTIAISIPPLLLASILFAFVGEWGGVCLFLGGGVLVGIVLYWKQYREVGLIFGPENYYLTVRNKGEGVWLIHSFVAFKTRSGILDKLPEVMEGVLLPALEEEGVILEIKAGNAGLAKLYEKCGFRRVDETAKKGYLCRVRMTTAVKEEIS